MQNQKPNLEVSMVPLVNLGTNCFQVDCHPLIETQRKGHQNLTVRKKEIYFYSIKHAQRLN
jgi:hypothetical protein